MLYIIHLTIIFIWLIYVMKKGRYTLHAIVTTYFFFVMFVDVPESIFSYVFGLYKMNTHLSDNYRVINPLGLLIADGYILPFTNMILLHYATRVKNLWKISLVIASTYGMIEWIHIQLGYLTYYKWSIWLSIAIYFFVSRFFINFASWFLLYNPPLPYSLRIAGATYSITVYMGAFLSGGLLDLYQWRPFFVKNPGDDDRIVSVSICFALALLSAAIIPKVKPKYRSMVFISFAIITIAFSYFAYSQGWLIYHKWNHLLTALYWLVSIAVLIWYDRWESMQRPCRVPPLRPRRGENR